jgi:hypothetical protein
MDSDARHVRPFNLSCTKSRSSSGRVVNVDPPFGSGCTSIHEYDDVTCAIHGGAYAAIWPGGRRLARSRCR